jgi:hypothetical protein
MPFDSCRFASPREAGLRAGASRAGGLCNGNKYSGHSFFNIGGDNYG